MSEPRSDYVPPDIQAIGDQLVYRQAEGYEGSYSSDRFRTGLIYGWNAALAIVAEKLGQDYEPKPHGERFVTVPCPDGHDSFTWEAVTPKMGEYRCECGHTSRCMERNAKQHHSTHRFRMACKAMQAIEDASLAERQEEQFGSHVAGES